MKMGGKQMHTGNRIKKAALYCGVAIFSISTATEAMAQLVGIEEITVTARKRDESLLEIPVSVSAFSQANLDAMGINTLDILSTLTPGFQYFNSGASIAGRSNPNLSFRGLSVFQPNPTSSTGSIFWNGSYMAAGGGLLPLIDLERAEVIKGPQTAFYGVNTFAGAVNFIPAGPGDEISGKGSVSFSPSNENSYNVTAAVGGPISDTFGVRVAAMQERVGADWQYRNGEPHGQENTTTFTGVAEWDATESFRVKLNGFYVDSDDTSDRVSQLAPVLPGQCNRTFTGEFFDIATREVTRTYTTDLSQSNRRLFCGVIPDFDDLPPSFGAANTITPDVLSGGTPLSVFQTLPPELQGHVQSVPDGLGSNYEVWRIDLNTEYDLANNHTLSSQLAYGEYGSFNLSDSNHGLPRPGNAPNAGIILGSIVRGTSETYFETRVTSGGEEKLRYMIGTNYYTLDNYQGFVAGAWNVLLETRKNFGIFGSVDYDITDQLTASLEGRWNKDQLLVKFQGFTGTAGTVADAEQKYSKFMPRVILSYQPTDDVNLYANWSRSYAPGQNSQHENYKQLTGIDLGLGTFTPTQRLDAYEIGLKQQPTDWLNYAVSAYHYKWQNQNFGEVTLLASGAAPSVNVPGSSRVYGIEFEAQAALSDWFELTGSMTYNDVAFTDYAASGSVVTNVLAAGANPPRQPGEIFSANGARGRYIPAWRGNITGRVAVNELVGMERQAWVQLTGIMTGDFAIEQLDYNVVSGYWKFNARAGVEINENFSVEIYGNNITNDLSYGNFGGTTTHIGSANGDRRTFTPLPEKREIGIQLSSKF